MNPFSTNTPVSDLRDLIGRENYMSILEAETSRRRTTHLALFGVKGAGKTSLLNTYFDFVKIQELSRDRKLLFVNTPLPKHLKGDRIYEYLLDAVKDAIELIADTQIKDMIRQRIADTHYETLERRLRSELLLIKQCRYNVVLLIDDFHILTSSEDVSDDHYDFLREYGQEGLLIYWVVSDYDFSDMYSTARFLNSFFVQNITNRKTVKGLSSKCCREMVETYLEDGDGIEFDEEDYKIIYKISGGICRLVKEVASIIYQNKQKSMPYDQDIVLKQAYAMSSCRSLVEGWCKKLTNDQREILVEVYNHGILRGTDIEKDQDHYMVLADNGGRGLLRMAENEDKEIFYKINCLLLEYYIEQGNLEYEMTEVVVSDNHWADDTLTDTGKQVIYQNVTNYNIGEVHQTTNIENQMNVLNVQESVDALIQMKSFLSGQSAIGEQELPKLFDQFVTPKQAVAEGEKIDEKEEEKIDKELDVFASSIFSSGQFDFDLTAEQKERFFLSEDILSSLDGVVRKNLISAIQVNDLLEEMIQRFNLELYDESCRGILFCKAMELHFKDCLVRPLKKYFKDMTVRLNGRDYKFKVAPIHEMTMGTFSHIFKQEDTKKKLGDICEKNNQADYNKGKWNYLSKEITKITTLRNSCCHPSKFTKKNLKELLTIMFDQYCIEELLVGKKI